MSRLINVTDVIQKQYSCDTSHVAGDTIISENQIKYIFGEQECINIFIY